MLGESYDEYQDLIAKGGSLILKRAFDTVEAQKDIHGKYIAMREIMMALIVVAAEKDAVKSRKR